MREQKPQIVVSAGRVALLCSFLILLLKLSAYLVTGSQVVFSDTIEGVVHLAASALTYFFIKLSAKPPDHEHPYGHGKSEFFSASFEGGLIAVAGTATIVLAVSALLQGAELREIDLGLILVVIAGAFNLLLALYLLKRGTQLHSNALKATALHLFSDFFTSVGSVIALVLVKFTGIALWDPSIAILLGSYLVWTGGKIVWRSAAGLLDARDLDTYRAFLESCNKVTAPGIIRIHRLRILRSGTFHFIDAHVVIPEFWTISEGHNKVEKFEQDLLSHFARAGEIHFHNDPCERRFCSECDALNCPIRKKPFESRRPYTIEDAERSAFSGPVPNDFVGGEESGS